MAVRKPLILLVGPLFRLTLLGFLRVLHGPPLKVGKCRFYGPPPFLQQCHAALEKLGRLDPQIHTQLLTRSRFTFFFHMTEIRDDRFNGIYSIPIPHQQWGAHGIVVRFIYAAFMQEMLGNTFPATPEQLCLKHDAIRIRTQEWLKRNHFPPELIAPFDESAMAG